MQDEAVIVPVWNYIRHKNVMNYFILPTFLFWLLNAQKTFRIGMHRYVHFDR